MMYQLDDRISIDFVVPIATLRTHHIERNLVDESL